MAVKQSIQTLSRIRRQYVQAKLWLYALQALAAILVGMAILWRWRLELPLLAGVAAAILSGAVLYFAWQWRRVRRTELRQVARHLNRQYPQLEDSTGLLLQEPQNLLQRLQQQKVASILQELPPEQVYTIKGAPTYVALALSLVLTAGILYLPAAPLATSKAESIKLAFPDTTAAGADTAAQIKSIHITVAPPRYTGKKNYKAESPNLRVEEGATVTWRIRTNKTTALQLQLNEQKPQAFKQDGEVYTFARSFTEAGLYTISLNGQKSAFYTLEIIPDEAPFIQISKPEEYTEIRLGEQQRVTLQASLTDDYGIRKANMVATVAKGSGEAVTFREEKIKVNLRGNSRSYRINQTLDLQQLGMSFGDELYFYLQAWDNHRGYTRSETYFVQIEDTTIAEADFAMTAGVNPVPEYFRSQRQIIIDTEKLLEEQKSIPRAEFEERSNSIGVDQKLLRLRYGKFLGEEFESGIGPGGGIPEGAEGHEEAQHFEGDGHDHPEFESQSSPEALLDPYLHKHDMEEAATLFEPAIKAKLKGALAQMWEAELRLRTFRPKEALPYEYKALRMLKDVQQSQRAYVAKTGFEAPPLKEPELRLTGELNKITPLSERHTIEQHQKWPQVRAALAWLATYKQTGKYKKADTAVLEKAGQELAQEALATSGKNLRTLQDLRQLISEMKAGKKLCAACLQAVERALTAALPPAAQTPQPQQAVRGRLAQEYMEQLLRE
ncbi:DUF4175 family protein [Pontibacter mangrovi]|uniref:DUF4175 family protein n=1 Tax=Pontibacter mangrovi TaxID=2589816 RepID=A0A501W6B4_9BACT|nr:DUF4175 family protein [Pontibacter mangrovi]TPE45443.1 hypothetical protein FJM65_05285 [Pontibacter mangrovi]